MHRVPDLTPKLEKPHQPPYDRHEPGNSSPPRAQQLWGRHALPQAESLPLPLESKGGSLGQERRDGWVSRHGVCRASWASAAGPLPADGAQPRPSQESVRLHSRTSAKLPRWSRWEPTPGTGDCQTCISDITSSQQHQRIPPCLYSMEKFTLRYLISPVNRNGLLLMGFNFHSVWLH